MTRKILHIDMDAFYASVEQRDNPDYRGKPIVVGGPPNSRGVVCAASYEARKFGIRSAMPCSQAYRLCPSAIFVRPRFEIYKIVSRQIREIFLEYTDKVEMLSLDEAFLDVTENKKGIQYATSIAKEIRSRIFESTNLTASAGVGTSKFVAKVATDRNKPNGMTVVRPEDTLSFIESLPIESFPGVGKVTHKKMLEIGIRNGTDLKKTSREELLKHFGKMGNWLYNVARGIDEREVESSRLRKSLGAESTFSQDLIQKEDLVSELEAISEELERRLLKSNFSARTFSLKIKFKDFTVKSRSRTFTEAPRTKEAFLKVSLEMLEEFLTENGTSAVPIRLLGLSLSHPESSNKDLEDGFAGSLFHFEEETLEPMAFDDL
ncbi:DNA polymerase IV [Leptospira perolatii]|uniref:DNA polymerase IV n=1 Tax=Leptospira perolatii TaxID=2023191 RepID=A0A2M9ZIR1_9LEPT|nr:DNA polymerase IV [Leptospira perolatii]PJZ68168.1 DNA polymerase IV [Leptospira perolatii]PJZ71946.1 DNA polymerase IV [Leptospira perolatii]